MTAKEKIVKVDKYMDLASGLSERVEKEKMNGEVKDPGALDKILRDICLQLLENAREIRKLAMIVENGTHEEDVKDEVKIEKMIMKASVAQGKVEMTRREKDVIIQLISGKTNREISEGLNIDEKTVKNHLWKIYRKMGINNRTQLLHRVFNE
jgi:DNA-binding NarL/FixJ family response regulator